MNVLSIRNFRSKVKVTKGSIVHVYIWNSSNVQEYRASCELILYCLM